MAEFDPAKEAINLAQHHISLARWVDLDMKVTFIDHRHDYGEVRWRAYGFIDGLGVIRRSPAEMGECGRSVCDARMRRR
jgi:uncharacterized DUF497 family protein